MLGSALAVLPDAQEFLELLRWRLNTSDKVVEALEAQEQC
jgi:hypothetical protein